LDFYQTRLSSGEQTSEQAATFAVPARETYNWISP